MSQSHRPRRTARSLTSWQERGRHERGQSLLEIGVMLPLFLLIVVGIIEIGSALNTRVTVINAARDGARLGSKGVATDDDIAKLVVMEADRLRDPIDPDADVIINRKEVDGVDAVSVEVCNDHSLLLGVPLVLPEELRMCSTTVMRVAEVK